MIDSTDLCLNCDATLIGAYCHGCGQKAVVHRSLSAFGHDLAHSIWHFDGKLWRTLPMLALWPGALTRAYIDGQRARFLSPLSLFLFAVFLTFAVFNLLGVDEAGARNSDAPPAATAAPQSDAATTTTDGHPTIEFNSSASDGLKIHNLSSATSDIPLINDALIKARENPSLMFYKLQSSAYKYAWALIPVSALFLWLLYPFNRRFGLYDHLVFVTYSLSFMLLLLVLVRIVGAIGIAAAVTEPVLVFAPPIHIYRQLRGTYGSTRLGAALRTVLVVIGATIILIAFMAGMLALGVWD